VGYPWDECGPVEKRPPWGQVTYGAQSVAVTVCNAVDSDEHAPGL
jgi:hypothetical protein